jgi:hypothetical protein
MSKLVKLFILYNLACMLFSVDISQDATYINCTNTLQPSDSTACYSSLNLSDAQCCYIAYSSGLPAFCTPILNSVYQASVLSIQLTGGTVSCKTNPSNSQTTTAALNTDSQNNTKTLDLNDLTSVLTNLTNLNITLSIPDSYAIGFYNVPMEQSEWQEIQIAMFSLADRFVLSAMCGSNLNVVVAGCNETISMQNDAQCCLMKYPSGIESCGLIPNNVTTIYRNVLQKNKGDLTCYVDTTTTSTTATTATAATAASITTDIAATATTATAASTATTDTTTGNN